MKVDVAIVGAGIVGLATALKLSERAPRWSVLVLDKEWQVGSHQTGHNSGVIHSGVYYKPGSRKAQMCTEGGAALRQFCDEEGIPYRRCGKLVVADRPDAVPRLDELERRGRANGLLGLQRVQGQALREHEPNLVGLDALYVPEVSVVNFGAVAHALARRLQARGVELWTGAPLLALRRTSHDVRLTTGRGDVQADAIINCAGLQCDRVARLLGDDPGVRIVPFRGEYWEVAESRRNLVNGLIYPVPDPDLPFLGIHLSRMWDGRLLAGPNAVLALAREGYRWRDVSVPDLVETFLYPGFWRMARRHWRTALEEMVRSLTPPLFVRDVQRMVPALVRQDLVPGGSGVRAQAVGMDGRLLDDFHIVRGTRAVHVLNAPSPAATSCLSIGESVAALAAEQFGN